MGKEDVAAGKVKNIKGKANDMIGAAKGDVGQQLKGKVQQGVGKVQEKLGGNNKKEPPPPLSRDSLRVRGHSAVIRPPARNGIFTALLPYSTRRPGRTARPPAGCSRAE